MARPEKKLAAELVRQGWREVRHSKHVIWRCGCGQHPQVTVAATPGEGRAMQNIVSFLSSKVRFGDCAIDKKKVLG